MYLSPDHRHHYRQLIPIKSRHDPTNIALIPDNQFNTTIDNKTWQTDRIGIQSTRTRHNPLTSVGRGNPYDSLIAPIVHSWISKSND